MLENRIDRKDVELVSLSNFLLRIDNYDFYTPLTLYKSLSKGLSSVCLSGLQASIFRVRERDRDR